MPVLRVKMDCNGNLQPVKRAFGPTDTSLEWWEAVLRDYRARPVDPKRHMDRLGYMSGGLTIRCHRCRLRKSFEVEDLKEQYGPEYMIFWLRFDLANCGRPHRHCGVLYE